MKPSAPAVSPSPKLIYLVTEDHYFYSHRLPMARAAQRAGFDVAVIANIGSHEEAIAHEGIRVIPLSLERGSLNPFKALRHIAQIHHIYRREKPDLVHHIAMKPVLYGSVAAGTAGVPVVINAFAGLGYLFTSDHLLARALRMPLIPLFRIVLKRKGSYLLLQNRDDLTLLRRYGMVPEERVAVIGGSGVDMERCAPQPWPEAQPDGWRLCVFAGRMIEIKGLATLKDAFALLQKRGVRLKLWLCGQPDPGNPEAWTESDIGQWVANSDNVAYKGHCGDMVSVWAQAHMAVQPSWGGEGVPKSLLEAASCARPIVATDVPGCRDVVEEGKNGLLVPPRDAEALAAALERLAGESDASLMDRGAESRRLIGRKAFSADAVSRLTEALYRRCAGLQDMPDEAQDLKTVIVDDEARYRDKAR